MKKLLLTTATAAALAIASSAFADDSTLTITQAGTGNGVTSDQSGAILGGNADVVQTGNGNTANVTQSDDGDALFSFPITNADIDQSGDGNTATVVQDHIATHPLLSGTGTSNAVIDQDGNGNTATATQVDDFQSASITQITDGNMAFATQGDLGVTSLNSGFESGGNVVVITQDVGDGNFASADMLGRADNVTILQNGGGNIAQATSGNFTDNNVSTIAQIGDGNQAFAFQGINIGNVTDSLNTSDIMQDTDNNLATVTQHGAGGISSIDQDGGSMASVFKMDLKIIAPSAS